MDEEVDAILHYHEETKHSEISVRFSGHRLDWSNKPPVQVLEASLSSRSLKIFLDP